MDIFSSKMWLNVDYLVAYLEVFSLERERDGKKRYAGFTTS